MCLFVARFVDSLLFAEEPAMKAHTGFRLAATLLAILLVADISFAQ